MPNLSFVTTCKGRLDHLRQTLPRIATQPDTECIVVDYDCPDGTADWVRNNFPSVKVVRVTEAPVFCKPHAQNLGAAAASATWLCLVDADILVDQAFSVSLAPLLKSGHYLRPDPIDLGAYGSLVCAREDFAAVEGFDETFAGCSYMDDDLYVRLGMAGVKAASFPGRHFVAIRHDDDLRTRYYEIKVRSLNHRINFLYANIKHDLMRQFGGENVPLATRRSIYAEVKRVVLAQAANHSAGATLEVNLPLFSSVPERYGWEIRRRWSFDFVEAKS
jgi:glycosyltransferase involved in cell wall biosynthesis